MAVAAAIGVGADEEDPSNPLPNHGRLLASRINNKTRHTTSSSNSSPSSIVNNSNPLGEINRSIEKMSLGGSLADPMPMPKDRVKTVTNDQVMRRDSNWTNSEGYGSLKSNAGLSRRCSEMSQASNLSTRANMSSPWDPLSTASSRRSSMVEPGTNQAQNNSGQAMISHIDRLQRKAAHMTPQGPPPVSQHNRQSSAVSDCGSEGQPPPAYGSNGAPRRASDPVRTLDRNFGVGANMSRHRSYSQLNNPQRAPLHGQQIRGQQGQNGEDYPGQYQGQQQFNYQQGYQGQPWPQQSQYGQPGYNSPYGYQQGYSNYPQGPEGQWQSQWQGHQNWAQNQQANWNQRSQQQSNNGSGEANNYQRTLEYVQQCQNWSGAGSNPAGQQPPPSNNGQMQ